MKKALISLFILFTISQNAFASGLFDGVQAINKDEIKKAQSYFKKYVNENPNDPFGRYWLAFCLKKTGDEDASRYQFIKSYEFSNSIDDVDFSIILENLCEDDYLDMALMYLEVKNRQKAMVYNDMALGLNPNSARGYYVRAQIFISQDEKLSAKNAMELAIQLDNKYLKDPLAHELEIFEVPPFGVDYYNSLGLKAYYNADFDGAISNFEKALQIEPKNVNVLNNVAQVYISNGNFDEARNILHKAKLFNLKYARTYLNLAKIVKIQGEDGSLNKILALKLKTEEKNNLENAIEINPNDKRAYLALGDWYFENKEYAEAYKNYKLAIDLDENFYEPFFGLVKVFVETKQTKKAISAIRNAGALNDDALKINLYLAKLCLIEGKDQEVLEYLKSYENSLKNIQMTATEYLEIAQVYFDLNKKTKAQETLSDGLKKYPNSLKIQAMLKN